MPNNIVKDFAKKSGKSESEVEKLWKKAKEISSEEFGKDEKDFTDKEWSYTTGVLKNMLNLDEKEKKEKKPIFLESDLSAEEYLNYSLYPTEEDMEEPYEDEEEMEETMTSPSFGGVPENPINPYEEDDDEEEEEEYGQEPYEDMVDNY